MSTTDIETFIPVAHGPSANAFTTNIGSRPNWWWSATCIACFTCFSSCGPAHPVPRRAARPRRLVDDDAAGGIAPPRQRSSIENRLDVVALSVTGRTPRSGSRPRARTRGSPCSARSFRYAGTCFAGALGGEPRVPLPEPPAHGLEAGQEQEPVRRLRRGREAPRCARDRRIPNTSHRRTAWSGDQLIGLQPVAARWLGGVPEPHDSQSVPSPGSIRCLEARVRRRVRDDRAERVQPDALARHRQPEPHQQPPCGDAVLDRLERAAEPRDRARSPRRPSVEAAGAGRIAGQLEERGAAGRTGAAASRGSQALPARSRRGAAPPRPAEAQPAADLARATGSAMSRNSVSRFRSTTHRTSSGSLLACHVWPRGGPRARARRAATSSTGTPSYGQPRRPPLDAGARARRRARPRARASG